ncbi:hypothetical protein HKD28_05735 [Gluconobacter sp. LMG 1744]|nr:hypothetical protein [Gluconobacter cadivus]
MILSNHYFLSYGGLLPEEGNIVRSTQNGLSRRQLLAASLALPVIGSLPGIARAAGLLTSTDFHQLCVVLTGKDNFNPEFSRRILKAFTQKDSNFPVRANDLRESLKAADLTDMSNFASYAQQNKDLASVALSIISACYLGYTGTPAMDATPAVGHPVDDATFITYVGALMYAPTKDTTVIPSYARGRTNYWVNPPSAQNAG